VVWACEWGEVGVGLDLSHITAVVEFNCLGLAPRFLPVSGPLPPSLCWQLEKAGMSGMNSRLAMPSGVLLLLGFLLLSPWTFPPLAKPRLTVNRI